MRRDQTDEGHMQQRTSEVLSPAALWAAEISTLAAAITYLPTFPALDAANAQWSDCRAALQKAETELNAKARFEPGVNGQQVPNKATRELTAARDRAEAECQKAALVVHGERDAAQKVLSAHALGHAAECKEVLGEVAVVL